MKDELLKPCPFCGGKARTQVYYNNRKDRFYTYIICEDCSAKSRTFSSVTDPADKPNKSLELAIEFWNKRNDGEGVNDDGTEN